VPLPLPPTPPPLLEEGLLLSLFTGLPLDSELFWVRPCTKSEALFQI
jgi:hypothetical protein